MGLAHDTQPLLEKKGASVSSSWVVTERYWVLGLTSLMAFLQVSE
jgi:hypothetical protein